MLKESKIALIAAVIGSFSLAGASTYQILDDLVIDHAEEETPITLSSSSGISASSSGGPASISGTSTTGASGSGSASGAGTSSTVSSSSSSTTSIVYSSETIKNKYSNSVKVHLVDIQLASGGQLKSHLCLSNGVPSYGTKATVSSQYAEVAKTENIKAAINGDFAYFSQNMVRKGYVIRNSVLYRSSKRSDASKYDDMIFYGDGTVKSVNEDDTTAKELLEGGVTNCFDFGPSLVKGGDIAVTTSTEVDQSAGSNPRTVFGHLAPLHYLFFVSEGRLNGDSANDGLMLYEAASFLKDKGVQLAYNLDGGGSSTMVYDGAKKNTTCNSGGSERKVSDIIYVTE